MTPTQDTAAQTAVTGRRRGRTRSGGEPGRDRKTVLFGYGLIAPQTIGFILVGVVAIFQVIWLSLHKVNALSGTQEFVGLDNYARMLTDPALPTILTNTFFFVAVLGIGSTVVALGFAILVNQKLRAVNFTRTAIFLPALITMVAWVLVWRFILQPEGLLDSVIGAFGASPVPWLQSRWLTLVVLAVVQLLKNIGIGMMLFLAALQGIPEELVDAAKVDGANRWTTFWRIIVPQLSATILMVFILKVVGSFKVFETVMLMTGGGPGKQTTVLSVAIYENAFELNDMGYSSTLAVLLLVCVLVLTSIIWQARRRLVFYEAD